MSPLRRAFLRQAGAVGVGAVAAAHVPQATRSASPAPTRDWPDGPGGLILPGVYRVEHCPSTRLYVPEPQAWVDGHFISGYDVYRSGWPAELVQPLPESPATGQEVELLWFRPAHSHPYRMGVVTRMDGQRGHAFVSYDERLTAFMLDELGVGA